MNKYAKHKKVNEKEGGNQVSSVNENLLEDENIKKIMETNTILEDMNEKEAKETIIVDGEEIEVNLETLRGRPRIHKEKMATISPKVDHALHLELKTSLTRRGLKIRDTLVPYMEEWVKAPKRFKYEYQTEKERKSHSIQVTYDFREEFSKTALTLRYSQAYVIECLYQDILKDLNNDTLKI